MSEGWIKVQRSLAGKGWSNRPEYVALWVHLLLMANHKNSEYFWNGKTIILKAGQLITGRKILSNRTGIEQSKVERILKTFESEQQIEQLKTSTSRLISIRNWNKYQKIEQHSEQPVNNDCTTGEQRVNTKEECNNDNNDKNDENPAPAVDLTPAHPAPPTQPKNFAQILKEDEIWKESVMMQTQVLNLDLWIDKFEGNLTMKKKTHSTITDYRDHFINYLLKVKDEKPQQKETVRIRKQAN